MKEIKIIQDDEGGITVEGASGPELAEVLSAALEQSGGDDIEEMEESAGGMTEPMGTLEENIPEVPKEKRGMAAKKKADWSDYGMR